jgi:hypothetical protein
VERGWSGANEHYTQQNSNIDYSIENLVKAENPKYIVYLLYQAISHQQVACSSARKTARLQLEVPSRIQNRELQSQ